ncbi:2'-5' RNA ligase family protein [Glaciibacter flavus]|uniref:2'-5' RNA ligase family protein n=1 Tax=Orlajensenia flava TaxID=2565934 RepID=UPI003B0013EB
MGDVVSVELVLDAATEALVRADWTRLAEAGLSSMAAHPSPSNRPHITLLVRPRLDAIDVADVARRLPIRVVAGPPILFRHGDRGVLVRPVEPSEELLRLHRAVHAAAPAGDDAPHTAPGEWTPHITLARRLRVQSLTDAQSLIDTELIGEAVALRRWDSRAASVTALPATQ